MNSFTARSQIDEIMAALLRFSLAENDLTESKYQLRALNPTREEIKSALSTPGGNN